LRSLRGTSPITDARDSSVHREGLHESNFGMPQRAQQFPENLRRFQQRGAFGSVKELINSD